MLKATSHANPKRKIHRGSLLTKAYLSFWIYTATAVHEVDATRLRMCMAQFPGACSRGRAFLFGFIRRTLFRALFPILYRSHVICLFEQAVKVLHILVTNVGCNGLHRLIGLL